MGSVHRYTAPFSTRVMARMRKKALLTESLSRSRSPWPWKMENSAPAPMDSPSCTEVRKVISV